MEAIEIYKEEKEKEVSVMGIRFTNCHKRLGFEIFSERLVDVHIKDIFNSFS